MTEFKQIIGRGTRIDEEYGKQFFTITDFKRATELFSDPGFNGDPMQIYEPGEDDSVTLDDKDVGDGSDGSEDLPPDIVIDNPDGDAQPRKYYLDGVPVTILAKRVQIWMRKENLSQKASRPTRKRPLRKAIKRWMIFYVVGHRLKENKP